MTSVMGGCHCGAIRFELVFPTEFCSHCHCDDCRRTHGAAFVTWAGLPLKQFKLLKGHVKKYESDLGIRWGFCADCGTSLLYDYDIAPEKIYVTVANLDGPLDREPDAHVSFEEQPAWMRRAETLPKFKGKTDERMLPPDWQPHLVGPELELRPLRETDFDSLFAAASDPLIWEVHPDRLRYTRERFETFFRSGMDSKGALAILDGRTGAIVGSSRFVNYVPEKSCVEIGYTFLTRPYWGGAYNRELKALMIDHAFRYVETIYFIVGKDNQRSRRAMTKIGGVLMPNLDGVPATRDISASVAFRITKAEWLNSPIRR